MKNVVYLTMYLGEKLPKWYIGSTNKEKIDNGYNGSVCSKIYKDIWLYERKHNKHLFKTRILSYHSSKREALLEEYRLQQKHNVVKNNKYINLSFAVPSGFTGGDTSNYIDYNKVSNSLKGNIPWNKGISSPQCSNKSFTGLIHLNSTKLKISSSNKGKCLGVNNSQYNTCWCVEENSENKDYRKKFNKNKIPNGWITCKEWTDNRKNKNGNYGKKWYNDGINNFLLKEEDIENIILVKGRIQNIK